MNSKTLLTLWENKKHLLIEEKSFAKWILTSLIHLLNPALPDRLLGGLGTKRRAREGSLKSVMRVSSLTVLCLFPAQNKPSFVIKS